MTTRRAFIGALAGGFFGAPFAEAQPTGKVFRIGYLSPTRPPGGPAYQAFKQALRERGWVEGENVLFEGRFAEGQFDRLPQLADELARLNVDVILASSTPAVLAAKRATATIPIVIPVSGDPVALGLAASLARPGGNVTGVNSLVGDIGAKHVELLKDTLPGLARVGFLSNADYTQSVVEERKAQDAVAVRQLGLSLHRVEPRAPADLDAAFARLGRERVQALVVRADPMTLDARQRIVELAAIARLPAIYGLRQFVEAGGLMAYGPSLVGLFRACAVYVDKILRGAHPGDLPMEQPTTFELVINLKTAKALGLSIPPAMLARADEVMQ